MTVHDVIKQFDKIAEDLARISGMLATAPEESDPMTLLYNAAEEYRDGFEKIRDGIRENSGEDFSGYDFCFATMARRAFIAERAVMRYRSAVTDLLIRAEEIDQKMR